MAVPVPAKVIATSDTRGVTLASAPLEGAAPAAIASPQRRAVGAWIAVDTGVALYKQNMVTNYFPIWVVTVMGGNDGQIALMNGVTMALLLGMEPWLGAVSDHLASRRWLLMAAMAGTCLLTLFIGGNLWWSIALFVVANLFLHLAMVLRNALLPAVSTPANRGRIEGYGVGLGYVGALLGIVMGYTVLNGIGVGAAKVGGGGDHPAIFRITAIAALALALPVFLWVKEPPRSTERGKVLEIARRGFQDLRQTAREARGHPDLVRFLASRAVYNVTTHTIALFAAVYITLHLGLDGQHKDRLFLLAILGAAAGAFIWGRVVDHIGPRNSLMRVLAVWAVALMVTTATGVVALPPVILWPLALLIGFSLAGIWTSDQPLMAGLSPQEHLGQFNGLYAFAARIASLTGPLIWALVAISPGLGRPVAMTLMAGLTLLAMWVLRPVSPEIGRQPKAAPLMTAPAANTKVA